MSRQAMKRAVDLAGGQSALARKVGTTQARIWYWLNKAERGCPAEWVLAVAKATGVSKHELRPDLYPLRQRRVS
jgi:DNA-binding transcriptional regulator YdaS (Cro superfamily)